MRVCRAARVYVQACMCAFVLVVVVDIFVVVAVVFAIVGVVIVGIVAVGGVVVVVVVAVVPIILLFGFLGWPRFHVFCILEMQCFVCLVSDCSEYIKQLEGFYNGFGV